MAFCVSAGFVNDFDTTLQSLLLGFSVFLLSEKCPPFPFFEYFPSFLSSEKERLSFRTWRQEKFFRIA